MVDFEKLRAARPQQPVTDPIKIFRRLPKPPGINELYPGQADALRAWYNRRDKRDTVIKLQTGGGKTLVGLLIAQSIMGETGEPVVYVCPTTQLVEQTLGKAAEYGIPAVSYDTQRRGEFPDTFLNGKSVLVCVYQALFNGLSRFGVRRGTKEIVRVGGMILDDAHVAFSSVRNAFTLRVARDADQDGYATLTTVFRKDFEDIGRIGTFDDVVDERTDGSVAASDFDILEVPYWAWQARLGQVRALLHEDDREERHKFVWPLIRDALDACHCLIGHDAVVITPILPPVDMIPTFAECPRRVFMSATIGEDSAIVRAFDADDASVAAPITSASLAGVSERMILAPELTGMPRYDTRDMLGRLATTIVERERAGTVILTPSAASARQWEDAATFADSSDKVAASVTALQTGKALGPFVFANRYDGIDLPGSSCRVLILWGLPRGASEYDLYRSTVFADSTALNGELAQRIEQGMGRGARGGSDYCVVIVAGKDLIARLSRTSNQRLLTSSTRAQIEMGLEISKAVTDEQSFLDTIMRCLRRDRDWLEYYAETLANLVTPDPVDRGQLALASTERKAFGLLQEGRYEEVVARLQDFWGRPDNVDQRSKGWLQQSAARAASLWGRAELAQDLQRQAFANNDNLLRPRTELRYEPIPVPGRQAEAIVDRVTGYKIPRGYMAAFDEIASHLVPSASSNQFEQALAELGAALGFQVDRPDNRVRHGPDVLWLMDNNLGLVIEAKSRKKPDNPLTKEEHGQLLNAEEWFRAQYPGYAPIRAVVHPNDKTTPSVPMASSRVLTLTRLQELIADARILLDALYAMAVPPNERVERCEHLLDSSSLRPQALVDRYLAPFVHET